MAIISLLPSIFDKTKQILCSNNDDINRDYTAFFKGGAINLSQVTSQTVGLRLSITSGTPLILYTGVSGNTNGLDGLPIFQWSNRYDYTNNISGASRLLEYAFYNAKHHYGFASWATSIKVGCNVVNGVIRPSTDSEITVGVGDVVEINLSNHSTVTGNLDIGEVHARSAVSHNETNPQGTFVYYDSQGNRLSTNTTRYGACRTFGVWQRMVFTATHPGTIHLSVSTLYKRVNTLDSVTELQLNPLDTHLYACPHIYELFLSSWPNTDGVYPDTSEMMLDVAFSLYSNSRAHNETIEIAHGGSGVFVKPAGGIINAFNIYKTVAGALQPIEYKHVTYIQDEDTKNITVVNSHPSNALSITVEWLL